MLKLIKLSLLLLLFAYTARAQENTESQKFLTDFFKDKTAKELFIYTDKLWPSRYDELLHSINADTLRGNLFIKKNNPDYIVLSKEEKAYILKCLQEQRADTWPNHLLPNSRLVLYDTIASIFKDRKREWTYFYSHYGAKFHSFSKPIFLRNNSLCFFYSDYSCGGLCGFGNFAIYRINNGKWEEIISLFSWIS